MKNIILCTHISKKYGTKVLFNDESFGILESAKIALIGRNGAGKSTLLRVILGQEELDSGSVHIAKGVRVGYVPQEDVFLPKETVINFLVRYTGAPDRKCYETLARFGFTQGNARELIESFSGGYQMRIKLAAMLVQDPHIILLDEPTNYLDLETILLLENFIQNFQGSVLLITHDREFIRRTCTQVLDIDQGKMTYFDGGIDSYLVHKESSLDALQKHNEVIERKKAHLQKYIDRFGRITTKAAQAKSKEKQVLRLDMQKREVYIPNTTTRMYIPEKHRITGIAIKAVEFACGYNDSYIVENVTLRINRGEKYILVGNNGEGKTTLLKGLLGLLPYTKGIGYCMENLRVSYYAQHTQAMLPYDMTVFAYACERGNGLTEEKIRSVLGSMLFTPDLLKQKIATLSGGEKARLAFASIFMEQCDMYVLDEPTNHLDLETCEILARSLSDFNGTVVFVSHDRTFSSLLNPQVIEVKHRTAKALPYSYQEYLDRI
jgi:ATP-binding cassette subfamily F protein 3